MLPWTYPVPNLKRTINVAFVVATNGTTRSFVNRTELISNNDEASTHLDQALSYVTTCDDV